MTDAERARLATVRAQTLEADWATFLAKSSAEREAIYDKVEATYQQHGVRAAQEMMRALGMPLPSDELCNALEELEAQRATGTVNDWLYEAMAGYGVSREEDAALEEPPAGHVDH